MHYHNSNSNSRRIFANFGNMIRLKFEFAQANSNFYVGIRIRRIFANSNTNSNWANFSPPLIKLERNTHGTLRLSQTNYIENILDRFNMAASRPVPSHMGSKQNANPLRIPRTEEEASAMIGVPYREAIGALLYLSIRTRPDIEVAVGTHASMCKSLVRFIGKESNAFYATYKGQRTKLLSSK
jgi:hypothetical protein